jgi:hypothetical protein
MDVWGFEKAAEICWEILGPGFVSIAGVLPIPVCTKV